MSDRILASTSPRQSPRSRIRWSMSSETRSPRAISCLGMCYLPWGSAALPASPDVPPAAPPLSIPRSLRDGAPTRARPRAKSGHLKAHHPAAFSASLLNAWPMGFYHPATLVKDAQRHGTEVFPIDVAHSGWKCRWAVSLRHRRLRHPRRRRPPAEAGRHPLDQRRTLLAPPAVSEQRTLRPPGPPERGDPEPRLPLTAGTRTEKAESEATTRKPPRPVRDDRAWKQAANPPSVKGLRELRREPDRRRRTPLHSCEVPRSGAEEPHADSASRRDR